jgi:hypothetical protein
MHRGAHHDDGAGTGGGQGGVQVSEQSDGERTREEAEQEIILLAERIEELLREREALRKALEPFAQLADLAHRDHRDSRPILYGMDAVLLQRLTIGHLRAAKAALSGEKSK